MLEPGPRIGENPTGAPAPVVARLFAGCAENPAMPPGAVSVAPSQIATPPSAVPTPVELTCTGTPYTNVCPASSTIASIGKDTAPPKSQFGSIASAKFAIDFSSLLRNSGYGSVSAFAGYCASTNRFYTLFRKIRAHTGERVAHSH